MAIMTVIKRGLPKLTTTATSTTAATSTAAATSTGSITSAASTYSSASFSSNSTSSSFTSSITPPSINGNPYIIGTSSVPSGTVFIIVGAIVGAIFLAILVWWTMVTYSSHKLTKSVQDYESKMFSSQHTQYYGDSPYQDFSANDHAQDHAHDRDGDNHIDRDDSVKIGLISHDVNEKVTAPIDFERSFSGLVSNSNRNSLFISPTGDILNQTRLSKLYQESPRLIQKPFTMTSNSASSNSLVSTVSSSSTSSLDNANEKKTAEDIKKPAKLAVSPHRKVQSSPGSDNSSKNSRSRGNLLTVEARRKATPSTYLEDMLEGKET
ncbi:hypothetical protein N7582_002934 [Saccharomyces uvarum]|uniref:Pheromone-regulated membrane protein 5 n=1 Tax=Saccharomyces uvarum TaxID=230603 RepID=A0AA35NUE9_SACUV|nr:hypothetical protein N7582_002934 [Saccharomyces uvarum]CAI4065275.1 hypothetical protein SUVC_09G0580 [Saccharomyces uvarum]